MKRIDLNRIDEFIELINDLVFIKDLNGIFLYCNHSYVKFIGKSKEDIIGKDNFGFVGEKSAQRFVDNDKKVLIQENIMEFEDTFTDEKGDVSYFHTTKEVICDENGNKIGLFCIARDITKQKQYQMIYEDRQRILEYIAIEGDLNKTLDEIVYLAQERNPSIKCSILLIDKDKEHLLSGSAPDLPDHYNNAIHGLKIGEKVGSCGSAAFKKERVIVEDIDKHENWQPYLELANSANVHSCWSEPIISSNNEILGTFAIYNEKPKSPSEFELKLISSYANLASIAIEKYENFKMIQEKELLIAHQSKMASMGEMLGNIAHQWRQPLSVISTGATGLKLEKEYGTLKDEKFFEICNIIDDNAQYLSKTIDDFRNYIKGDRKQIKFSVKDEVESFLRMFEGSIKHFNIDVDTNLEDNIEIFGYPSELKQCFINIFSNARDALKEVKEDERYIKIVSKHKDDRVVIEFIDNAGGVPEDIISKIFEPYFTTKHQSKGTGLGLNMAYRLIVEGMEGALEVENIHIEYQKKIYNGARFIITLPAS